MQPILAVEHIPTDIKKLIGNNLITSIYRIQAYNLIMCGYFYIGFIHFGCSVLVRQRPMKSLSSICPSVCPSVCSSVRH